MDSVSKKIVLIYLWHLDIGGIERRVLDIVAYLNKFRPDYQIVLLLQRGYSTPILKKISRWPKIKVLYFMRQKKKKNQKLLLSLWLLLKVWQINPDIILTFLDRSSVKMVIIKILLFWKKIKVVLNEGIYTPNYVKVYSTRFWQSLIKVFYPLADKIIVPSKAVKKGLVNKFNVPASKIVIVNNWTLLRNEKMLKKFYDYLYLGRLEKEKNIFWLIDLIKFLKNRRQQVKLAVLGEGSLAKRFNFFIRKFNLRKNIIFFGSKKNPADYINKSKILLLASLNEGMPVSVLEAGALGVPGVVNNFQGAGEIIQHAKTGFIARDKKEFFLYAEKLLLNEKLRRGMSQEVKQHIQQNFGQKNLEKFIKILLA